MINEVERPCEEDVVIQGLIIPEGIILNILSHLTFEDWPKVARVCKSWMRVASSDVLWKRYYPQLTLDGKTYYEYFLETTRSVSILALRNRRFPESPLANMTYKYLLEHDPMFLFMHIKLNQYAHGQDCSAYILTGSRGEKEILRALVKNNVVLPDGYLDSRLLEKFNLQEDKELISWMISSDNERLYLIPDNMRHYAFRYLTEPTVWRFGSTWQATDAEQDREELLKYALGKFGYARVRNAFKSDEIPASLLKPESILDAIKLDPANLIFIDTSIVHHTDVLEIVGKLSVEQWSSRYNKACDMRRYDVVTEKWKADLLADFAAGKLSAARYMSFYKVPNMSRSDIEIKKRQGKDMITALIGGAIHGQRADITPLLITRSIGFSDSLFTFMFARDYHELIMLLLVTFAPRGILLPVKYYEEKHPNRAKQMAICGVHHNPDSFEHLPESMKNSYVFNMCLVARKYVGVNLYATIFEHREERGRSVSECFEEPLYPIIPKRFHPFLGFLIYVTTMPADLMHKSANYLYSKGPVPPVILNLFCFSFMLNAALTSEEPESSDVFANDPCAGTPCWVNETHCSDRATPFFGM